MKTAYKCIIAVTATVLASVFSFISDAQTMPSLVLDQNPVSVATGMCGVASEAGAYALEDNVAAVSLSGKTLDAQIGLGIWQPSYADLKTMGAGAVYRLGKLGLGLDFKMLRMPAYGSISDNGADIRDSEFTPKETNMAVGVSYAFMDCLSAGATLRYADSRLASDASASVFGADIAAYFKKNGFSAGLSVNNIGTKVQYTEKKYPQPMMAKIGAGYDLELGTSSLFFTAEADVLFAGGIMAGAGCEYSFKDMIFARAGYHYGNSANTVPSYASAGLGLNLFGVQLNFAYIFGSATLSNSLLFSLGYSF